MARLERFARILDARFRLPGTRFRFGWDPIVGIFPGVGDAIMLVPGFYILFRARHLQLRRRVLMRMAANLWVDWLIGSIPLIGVAFDAAFKANLRNLELIRQEIARDS